MAMFGEKIENPDRKWWEFWKPRYIFKETDYKGLEHWWKQKSENDARNMVTEQLNRPNPILNTIKTVRGSKNE